MKTFVQQIISLMALCTLSVAAAVAPSELVPVSCEQVAGAIHEAGFDTSVAQLQLLSNVRLLPGTKLQVARMTRQTAGTILAELHCQARQCLPFYVLVHDTQIADGATMRSRAGAIRPAAAIHPLLERGKTVTLLIQNADLRIVVPVISLENGVQGQVIRVTSPDHKRVYRAEIIDKTTVRSAL